MKTWLHDWYITLRWSSRLTRAGRELRRNMRDGPEAYVEATPPDISPERARQILSEPKPAPFKIDPSERSVW